MHTPIEIKKTNGRASVIWTKADVPTQPNAGRVQFFLDLEGIGCIGSRWPKRALEE